MKTTNEALHALLICIGSKCDLQALINEDHRFGVRLLQATRGCLGSTTQEAESFLESVFGRAFVSDLLRTGADKPVLGRGGTPAVQLPPERSLKEDH